MQDRRTFERITNSFAPFNATEAVVSDMDASEGKHLELYGVQNLALFTMMVPVQVKKLNGQI